jgi:hypothetical protein
VTIPLIEEKERHKKSSQKKERKEKRKKEKKKKVDLTLERRRVRLTREVLQNERTEETER